MNLPPLPLWVLPVSLGLVLGLPITQAISNPSLAGQEDQAEIHAVILSKLGPPTKSTTAVFLESGMLNLRDHRLSPAERKTVENAVDSLPPLYRKILAHHLSRLSFVDGIPGGGTGLTEPLDKSKKEFNLTFRADILHQTASQFMTWKEQRCFSPDGSKTRVSIDAGDVPAFTYVLLHEAAHVTDFVLGINNAQQSPFHSAIWLGPRMLAPPYDSALMAGNVFRNGKAFEAHRAPDLYRSLATTPFVSLYASASEFEDLAELSAYYELSTELHVNPKIEVRSGDGSLIYSYEPMRSDKVRSRLPMVEKMLASSSR